MRILLSGSSGLVGTALAARLGDAGDEVWRLVRRDDAGEREVAWDPAAGTIDAGALEGFDAVVHLAGEPIAEGRWTEERKRRIRDSRVGGTRLLAGALAACDRPPAVLVSASAVGIYGDRGDLVLTEDSRPGDDFLADVCRLWESATHPAEAAGIRVVHARFGIILSPDGGALATMLPPFRLGLGGRLGDGTQHMSWVALDDAVGAVLHALATPELAGPMNVTAPQPVSNSAFTATLGRVLRRPTILPLPGFGARLLFGEMADALLLASQRARPVALERAGYAFRHPALEDALRALLAPGEDGDDRPARDAA